MSKDTILDKKFHPEVLLSNHIYLVIKSCIDINIELIEAALLHDIGCTICNIFTKRKYYSPNHHQYGIKIFNELLLENKIRFKTPHNILKYIILNHMKGNYKSNNEELNNLLLDFKTCDKSHVYFHCLRNEDIIDGSIPDIISNNRRVKFIVVDIELYNSIKAIRESNTIKKSTILFEDLTNKDISTKLIDYTYDEFEIINKDMDDINVLMPVYIFMNRPKRYEFFIPFKYRYKELVLISNKVSHKEISIAELDYNSFINHYSLESIL